MWSTWCTCSPPIHLISRANYGQTGHQRCARLILFKNEVALTILGAILLVKYRAIYTSQTHISICGRFSMKTG
ncbi:hypothetical protein Y032_0530g3008 [Ancylostoma ceylanicum]|uniref:Uncharacterized protein n=1 Tax=Ancylostoma ceylanicum TaxID=53326 RepID=A0A016WS72_9BILA|nr:hypothetical protein Y032_0530g3008 [Ancylostoma ceylanicum]